MALKHFVLIFLFALFLSSLHEIQARDSQMFNKIPSKTNEVVVEVKQPEQNLPNKEQENEQPNFTPENTENSYGLYGHESGQFSPSSQTQTQTQTQNNNNNQLYQTNPNRQNNFPYNAKYLPKNYNTVAYVTQPEDFNDNINNNNNNNQQTKDNGNGNNYNNAQKKDLNNEFDFLDNEEGSSVNDNFNNKNSYYNNDVVSNNFNTRFMDASKTANNNNYYNAQQKDVKNEFDFNDTEDNFANDNNNNYFNNDAVNNNGNSYYNNDVVSNNNNNNFNTRFMDASETNNNNNYYSSGKSRVNRAEPQGMSDTRFMENGKYHYDINTGKYSRDHPYVNPMAMRNQYNPTSTGYNNVDNSYQYNNYNEEVEQYQNEDNMP